MIRSPLRRFSTVVLTGVVALATAGFAADSESPRDRDLEVAGWIERVRLTRSGLELEAKLDSGAEHSSLDVEGQKYFRRGGDRWVRFTVEGASGRRVAFERKLVRRAVIKRHSGRSDVRPVVEIKICLGSAVKKVEVNLVDRSNFVYPMLLGRSFLGGAFLIDTSREARHLQELDCPGGG